MTRHSPPGGVRPGKVFLPVAAAYQPDNRRAVIQILNSVLPYLALWAIMAMCFRVSPWITLALTPLAAGFLVRIFIIFHDCGHRSFVTSPRAGSWIGFLTGVLTLTPFFYWSHQHARHHATTGNLDRRGTGDIWTLTLREYREASPVRRLVYRVFRNPLVMFVIGPAYMFLIKYRFAQPGAGRRWHRSVLLSNLAIFGVAALGIALVGWKAYLLIQIPVTLISGAGGVWLFYVQHQFEDAYWVRTGSWDFAEAAVLGSSYYRLPGLMQWFSGNIGFHHIHHLNPRIPNYALPRCHTEHAHGLRFTTLGLRESLTCLRLRVWDEDRGRMIALGFAFL